MADSPLDALQRAAYARGLSVTYDAMHWHVGYSDSDLPLPIASGRTPWLCLQELERVRPLSKVDANG